VCLRNGRRLWINDVVERVHDEGNISFGPKTRLVIIDPNNISCVLRNDDAINNVINVFFKWTPLHQIPKKCGLPL